MSKWNGVRSANYKFKDINEVVRRIKNKVGLVQVMADAGLVLPNSNQRTVKINCFQHADDTPSLVISPEKGLFNCFGSGCQAGGDTLAFVMQFHRFEFGEALNFLVERYEIPISDLVLKKTPEDEALDRYADLNEQAARLFHHYLSKNTQATSLLAQHGISDEICAQFLIGYAPSTLAVLKDLRGIGRMGKEDVETLQFSRSDIFTNRIIYPMRDLYGRITHFYGRAVGEAQAKYIGMAKTHNEKAHPLIDKAIPFGLHAARDHISREQGRLIMVEGHNDVLGLMSHGIMNVCAMMTSTPSEKQYALLKNLHIKNILICPDGDAAGFRAIESINKNRAAHQSIKIITIPDGSDPDEFVRDQGPFAFMRLVDEAVYPIEIVIRDVAEKYINATSSDKLDLSKTAMEYISNLSGFEREFALDELSTITNASRDSIEETIAQTHEIPMTNLNLEGKVIGECINDKAKAIHAMSVLAPDDFTHSRNTSFWKAIKSMIEADIDPFTREMFTTYAIDKGFITDIEAEHVPKDQLGSLYSLDYAMAIITDLALRRRLVKSANKLLIDAKSKQTDVRDVLNGHLSQISTTVALKQNTTSAKDQIESAMALIHERMTNPGIPGINIGPQWKKFMHCIMGFQKGHMLAIAGVTKTGKTAIAQNWCLQQLIYSGEPTLWVNLEMSEADLTMRNLGIMSGVDVNAMKLGNISREAKDAIDKAAVTYNGFKLHIANLAGGNVFDIVNCIRRFVYTTGIKLVFIDYLQLIRTEQSRKGALWEAQNDVVASIRECVSRLGIAAVVISQLNRGAMAESSASGQFVSGTIKLIQDADCFMGIRRKTKTELEFTPHANSALQIEYNRHGPQGLEIDLNFRGGSMQIREV